MQFCVGFKFRKFSQSDVMVHSKNLDNSIIGLFCENLNNFSTILAFDGLKNGIRDFVCLYIIIYFNNPPELFFSGSATTRYQTHPRILQKTNDIFPLNIY